MAQPRCERGDGARRKEAREERLGVPRRVRGREHAVDDNGALEREGTEEASLERARHRDSAIRGQQSHAVAHAHVARGNRLGGRRAQRCAAVRDG